jgi:dipeptidyl aminopeptidase/acylaminoacyl peptidase
MQLSSPSIDRIAIALIIVLSIIIGLLIGTGTACQTNCIFHTGGRVSNFSWQNKTIGYQDRAFLLTFNRPVDRGSVEQHLTIVPPLPGKISWSGLRLAYTLNSPAPYGEGYKISLSQAKDKFAAGNLPGKPIEPFEAKFRSRDRAFAYIGSQGEEQGRLILYDWTKQQKKILTPANLVVFEFTPYPQGDRLLFSASFENQGVDGIRNLQLYTVTTGLAQTQSSQVTPKVELILDAQKYQNNKFALAQDGEKIVVQRLNREQPDDFGLWVIETNQKPQLITDAQVGDFLITPDSQTVAVAQGEGIALLPLEPNAQPLDFLPKFGQVLSFTADGTGAAMINYNTDNAKLRYTRSLFYVNNQGIQQELLNTEGSIQDCQFAPTSKTIYCWLTELEKGIEYSEKPYLAAIDLKSATSQTLLKLPKYQDSTISIAPDGLGILFSQFPNNETANPINPSNSSIWLLIPPTLQDLESQTSQAENLPFVGFHPQWLP